MNSKKQKIVGIIPARMAASRFPGKPLFPLKGRPMLEHVYCRSQFYKEWDSLCIATCDKEIESLALRNGWPVVMTSDSHTRALDRVAEAALKCNVPLSDRDIIVCVQGDEPMLQPDMIAACVQPLLAHPETPCTVLGMQIADRDIFENPDTVKIVHNERGEVLYTSRAPVPYCKGTFGLEHGAKRIFGIFAFRLKYLLAFTQAKETNLERLEACDSNRILDSSFRQIVAPYRYRRSYSVDSPSDVLLVETHLQDDPYWGRY